MSESIRFDVIGLPKPKGSKRAFIRGGRAILVESSKGAKPWEQQVHWTAREVVKDLSLLPWSGPIKLRLEFRMPRVSDTPKRRTRVPHTRTPDLDKLVRTTKDGLTGVVWIDDKQVFVTVSYKRYAEIGEPSGCRIIVSRIEG